MSKKTTIVSLNLFDLDAARYPNMEIFTFDDCPKEGDHLVVLVDGVDMLTLEKINIRGFRGTKLAVYEGEVKIPMSELWTLGFSEVEKSFEFEWSNWWK